MKRVFPLIVPQHNLMPLKELANQVLKLDFSTSRKGPMEPLIVLTKFLFLDEKMEEVTAIRKAKPVAKHLSFTFVIMLTYEEADQLSNLSNLQTTRHTVGGGYVIVASGTLEDWGNFIRGTELIAIKQELEAYFKNIGLGPVL